MLRIWRMGKRINFLLLTIHVYLFISLTHTCDFYCKRLNKFLFLNLIYSQNIYQRCFIYTYIRTRFIEPLCVEVWTGFWLFLIQKFWKKKINSLVLHGSKPFSQSLQKSYFIVYRNEFKFTVSFIRKSI